MDINGTANDDTLTGTQTADRIFGLDGNDGLFGLGGADWLEGGQGDDTLDGGTGNDTLYGDASGYWDGQNDLLLGGAGNDSLYGSWGDDILDGGAGTDRLDGGWGFDTVLYSVNTTPLVIDLAAGLVKFTGQSWSPEALVGIEGVIAGSSADSLIGSAEANLLSGGLGNDTLLGGEGTDTLIGGGGRDQLDGGAGSDAAVYAEITTSIRADLRAGVLTFVGQNWPAETLTSIENLTTGSGNDTVTGAGDANAILTGAGRDSLIGAGGGDYLDGGAGADTMAGGVGDDTYVIDNTGDRVTESGGGLVSGIDAVISNRDFTLGVNMENLSLTGNNNAFGLGNGLGNVLTGDDSSNSLRGVAGADTLIAGLGNDDLEGGDGNDRLAGGAYSLTYGLPRIYLTPEEGYEWQPPDDGRDSIDGGAGIDTLVYVQYIYEDEWSTPFLDRALRVDLGAATARAVGVSGSDTLISIENVATANADDTVLGSAGANEVWVNYGRNAVDGGGGDDTIHGGEGLRFPFAYYDADYVYGLNDTIEILRGGAGNDVIYSGGAIAYYDQFHDWSKLRSSDSLQGDAGADRLIADIGATAMTGGSGADRFEFSTEIWDQGIGDDFYISYAQIGKITDFNRSQGDKIVIEGAQDRDVSFAGESNAPAVSELAYHRVISGGRTNTVIELPLGDYDSNGDDGENETLTITLADYSGSLTANDFLLA